MLKADETQLPTSHDRPREERLLNTSKYIYQRFMREDLPPLLKHYPTVGIFNGTSLQGFLLSQTVNAPCAWIGGFRARSTESRSYNHLLVTMLAYLMKSLIGTGGRRLYYSGNHIQHYWLRHMLLPPQFLSY